MATGGAIIKEIAFFGHIFLATGGSALRNSTQTSENNKIELRGALNRVVEDMIARQGTVSDVCSNATLPSASFLTFSYIFELITGSDVHEQQISSLHNN